jgi:hypothetical protein
MNRCLKIAVVSMLVLTGAMGVKSALRDTGGPMPQLSDTGGPMPQVSSLVR